MSDHPVTGRTEIPQGNASAWKNILKMLPYVWEYRGRVLMALAALVISKLAMVLVPLVLKEIVDALDVKDDQLLVLPIAMLVAYGVLRMINSVFNELRDVIFAKVRYHAMHRLSREVLAHLYRLSLSFHLDRKTGNISQDLNRGAQSVSSILNYLVFKYCPDCGRVFIGRGDIAGKISFCFCLGYLCDGGALCCLHAGGDQLADALST